MASLSLKQLEIFVCVAELSSFSGAAQTLYLTQSTVSTHIHTLETVLGVQLFLRDARRNVSLSADGQRLYPYAKKLLAEAQAVESLFWPDGEATLLLGASTVPAQYLLPELLAGFLRKNPNIRYSLKKGDSASVHALLQEREIRIGFVGAASDPASFAYFPVATDKLVLAAPNTEHYRALRETGKFGRDLLSEPTVAREEGSGTDRTVQNYMHAIGFDQSRLNIVARVDDPETIKHMVMQGAGVSILSALAIERELLDRKLLAFELDENGLQRSIYMAYRKDFRPTLPETSFLDFVQNKNWNQ